MLSLVSPMLSICAEYAVTYVSLTLPPRVALIASHRRQVFNECDDPLLKYLDDDGQSIEPQWYQTRVSSTYSSIPPSDDAVKHVYVCLQCCIICVSRTAAYRRVTML